MARIVIKDFKGINSSIASLQLKPGELESSQNLTARPYFNYARRKGVEPVSVQTTPVLGIHEFDLDNITIPIIQTTSLEFFPDLSSPSFPDPNPYPLDDPLDAAGSRTFIFNIEQTMRAIQDRRVTAGHSAVTWPTISWRSDGTQYGSPQAVSSYPANNIYGPDQAYDDIANGNPIGTKSAALVNAIIAACISTVGFNDWINTIAGQSSVTLYTSSIFPSAGSATRANYRTKLSQVQAGIRLLTTIQQTAQQNSVEEKSGTAQDAGICGFTISPTTVSISGYSSSYFDASGCNPCLCNDNEPCQFTIDGCLEIPGSFQVSGSFCGFDRNVSESEDFCPTLDNSLFDTLRITTANGLTWTLTATLFQSDGGSPYCFADGAQATIWQGTMTTATLGDARGTYTRTAGCDSRATVVIV